ncbi:MAG: glycosyltransferase [Gemmataceae bacterium]|nr:glycosyltransferase [Gemmataceae bacterium]
MIVCLSVASLLLLASLLLQLLWAGRFMKLYSRGAVPPADELPRAAVVLSVRGADPSLAGCLEGLLRQDYPDYRVVVIVDSRDDPAWAVVQHAVAESRHPDVTIQPLTARRRSCSLKLSALVQAIGELDESFRIIALIDADGHAGPGWLRELASPLRDPAVGASTGVRWFIPGDNSAGTLVRYLWNVAAVTQMNSLGVAWGGSLAFRRDALEAANLVRSWKHSFAEDVGAGGRLRRLGYRVETVAAATMVSAESTGLRDCFRFIRRQLLCARLHHERWRWVLTQGLADATLSLATWVMLGTAIALGWWGCAVWAAGLLTVQYLGLAIGLRRVAARVQSHLAGRGCVVGPVPAGAYAAIPLSRVVYAAALVAAAVARTVAWRGITYRVTRPRRIRLIDDVPFLPAVAGGRASLI